jgi:diguanylate cyclase (GGDEF)-like protein
MNRIAPLSRIALGLVAVTCSLILLLDLVGIIPSASQQIAKERIRDVEGIVTQTTLAANRRDMAGLRTTLELAVRRNDQVLSAALRNRRNQLLISTRDHPEYWKGAGEESTATHVQLPIYQQGERWGTLEVRYAALEASTLWANIWQRPTMRLGLAMGALGFLSYALYMRRTLRYLDPSSVIPPRVQNALDVMVEGVILIDRDERIVLANEAICSQLGRTNSSLMGMRPDALEWRVVDNAMGSVPPWTECIQHGAARAAATLARHTEEGEKLYRVKSSPVLGGWDRPKGAIVTFSDVTELERHRVDLEQAVAELEKSREEIRLQNEELTQLAKCDPLTGVANRRSFMEWVDREFRNAQLEGTSLCCVMLDIDHFKKVNDEHGHAMGDEVIQRVAGLLRAQVRTHDVVCRYGGEEFCVVLLGIDLETTATIADRLREKIAAPGFTRVPLSASFGVSSIRCGASTPAELIDQADRALYVSKNGGRNRLTRFDEIPADAA